jgi:hypothetical protein
MRSVPEPEHQCEPRFRLALLLNLDLALTHRPNRAPAASRTYEAEVAEVKDPRAAGTAALLGKAFVRVGPASRRSPVARTFVIPGEAREARDSLPQRRL